MSGDPRAYSANPRQLANPVPGVAQQDSLDDFMAKQKIPNAPAPQQASGTPAPAPSPQGAAPAQPQTNAASSATSGDASLDDFLAQPGQTTPPQDPGSPQLSQQDQHTADKLAAQQGYVRGVDGKMHPPTPPISEALGNAWTSIHDMFTLPRDQMLKKMRDNVADGYNGDAGSKWIAQTLINNTVGMPDQIHDLNAQTIANVAKSGLNKQQLLEKQLGAGNVKVGDDGAISFRYPGETDFRPLAGAPGFNLLGDTAGNPRQLFKETMTDVPAAFAGGLAFGLTGGMGAGTVPAVYAATRAAMQWPANAMLDKFEESQGATRDQNRNRLAENLMDTGVEAGFGAINTLMRYAIPGTNEYEKRMNRKALTEVQLTDQARQLANDSNLVTNSGAFQTVDMGIVDPSLAGKKMTLRADQLFSNDAKVMRGTQQVTASPQFQNVQNAQVNNAVEAVNNIAAKISQYTGDNASGDVEKLASVVSGINQAEGKTIGSFKAKAMAQIGNEKLPVPQDLHQQAAAMMSQIGFTVAQSADGKSIQYIPPTDLRPLMGQFGITKMGDMRAFVNTLQDYAQTSSTGLRIDEIDRLVNTVGNLNGVAGRNGGQIAAAWGQFSGGLRQFRRDAIGAGLVNDLDVQGFNQAMDKFGALRDASNTLSRTLDDDFTSNAIVQQVFNRGRAGLQNLRAIKALLADYAPQTWAALKQSWMDDMLRRHSNPSGPVPFNFAGMQKELNGYGDTFLNEAFEGSGVNLKDVKAVMNVAQSIQTTYRNAGAPAAMDEKVKQSIFNTVAGLLGDMRYKTMNGLQQAFGMGLPGNPLLTVFDPDSLATRLAKYNGPGSKPIIQDNLQRLYGTSAIVGSMGNTINKADRVIRGQIKAMGPKGTPAQPTQDDTSQPQ